MKNWGMNKGILTRLKKLCQTRHAEGGVAGLTKMSEAKIRILAIAGMMLLAYIVLLVGFKLSQG